MRTEYQRGRNEALRELGTHFATSADACQRRICEVIGKGRAARYARNEELWRKYDKEMSEALSEKIGHIKALSAVMALETKDRDECK